MAQVDVYTNPTGAGYLLDVQVGILQDLRTRLVVPLMMATDVPQGLKRLHPVFEIAGRRSVMVTQLMAAVPISELQQFVTSLARERHTIIGAIDFLLGGI
jgi:toxin CcdB